MSSNNQQQQVDYNSSATKSYSSDQILAMISKQLKIQDLVKGKSLVCDDTWIPQLIICKTPTPLRKYWFNTSEQFNLIDAIDMATFHTCKSLFRLENWLTRLYFNGTVSDFNLLAVNDLNHLKELQICIKDVSSEATIQIDLPNLKNLEIENKFPQILNENEFPQIHITAPKLEMLNLSYTAQKINVTHPNSLIHIDTSTYTAVDLYENLQYLQVGDVPIPYGTILSSNPKLTTLVLGCKWRLQRTNERTIAGLRELLKQKSILKRHQLKIYLMFVELSDIDQIDEWASSKSDLAFQMSNYSLMCTNSCCVWIDFNELMELVNDELPEDFHKKFPLINSVKVKGNVDRPERFIEFLKSCSYLDYFSLDSTSFGQSFYDRLPEIAQLKSLTLYGSLKPITNFDFLFKLKYLNDFWTTEEFAGFLDLSLKLYEKLKFFQSMRFSFQGTTIEINNWSKKYEFLVGKVGGPKMDFDHLFHFIEGFKKARSF